MPIYSIYMTLFSVFVPTIAVASTGAKPLIDQN